MYTYLYVYVTYTIICHNYSVCERCSFDVPHQILGALPSEAFAPFALFGSSSLEISSSRGVKDKSPLHKLASFVNPPSALNHVGDLVIQHTYGEKKQVCCWKNRLQMGHLKPVSDCRFFYSEAVEWLYPAKMDGY